MFRKYKIQTYFICHTVTDEIRSATEVGPFFPVFIQNQRKPIAHIRRSKALTREVIGIRLYRYTNGHNDY